MASTPENFDPYASPVGTAVPKAAYFHVPFCLHRCGYCDFTLVAQRDDLIPAWLQALENELDRIEERYTVETLFIGGGTPTHLTVNQLTELVTLIQSRFALTHDGEFSIEANPDGLDDARLDALKDLGVNRLSLGVQSFDDNVLKTLERQHGRDEAIDVIQRASDRFENLSIDLIFGVPGLSTDSWIDTLQIATALPVSHISTYGLTFEKGTEFFRRLKSGTIKSVSEELEREMYATAMRHLSKHSFLHYEISNFARPGFECRHNRVYWKADEYFAFGPGAARYVNGIRSTNARNVVRWINCWSRREVAVQESENLSDEEKVREAVFLGLRLVRGIHLAEFEQRFGVSLPEFEHETLSRHMSNGLLEISHGHLRLTEEGRFVADTVISDFL